MTFLYPGFLAALSVLAVPVIIHLFNFRKTRKVYFSNTRLLNQVREATSAKRKLKHLLVLITRLLFLAFLVFAFAQPVIPAREQNLARKDVVIYLDNSFSMSGRMGDRMSAFDAALEFARQIVELFPSDTRYLLLTDDFEPFSNTYKSQSETADLLTQIRMSPVSRTMNEISEKISQHPSRGNEIFWISDFQRSTIGDLHAGPSDSTAQIHLVPLSFEPSPNIFVDTAYLENPFVVGGERNRLIVKLRNSGVRDASQLLVKLLVDGIQSGTGSLRIPAGGTAQTTFDLTSNLSGFKSVVISFDDNPVTFDNEFYLSLNFSERIRVAEIKSVEGSTVIGKVFANDKVFAFTGFPQGNINYNVIGRADLVIVNGLNNWPGPMTAALSNYLQDFGTVLIVPGDDPALGDYRALGPLVRLTLSSGDPSMELAPPDFHNPFFENVFEEQSDHLAMPAAKRLLNWGSDPSAILKFRDGSPFLSVFHVRGKLYALASPLQESFTDFFNNALFVPVMYRMAASGKRNDFRAYYSVNDPIIAVKVDSLSSDVPLRLVGDNEIIPQQRRLGDAISFELPKFSLEQGFYKVVYSTDTIANIALNLDKSESFLEQYTAGEVRAAMGPDKNVTIFDANSTEAFGNEIKTRYLGKPLWKYALAIALVFLATEIMLIRFLK